MSAKWMLKLKVAVGNRPATWRRGFQSFPIQTRQTGLMYNADPRGTKSTRHIDFHLYFIWKRSLFVTGDISLVHLTPMNFFRMMLVIYGVTEKWSIRGKMLSTRCWLCCVGVGDDRSFMSHYDIEIFINIIFRECILQYKLLIAVEFKTFGTFSVWHSGRIRTWAICWTSSGAHRRGEFICTSIGLGKLFLSWRTGDLDDCFAKFIQSMAKFSGTMCFFCSL